jgi:hypothetical protein
MELNFDFAHFLFEFSIKFDFLLFRSNLLEPRMYHTQKASVLGE